MTFDYTALKDRISKVYHSRREFADDLGVSPGYLSMILSGKYGRYFTQLDIYNAAILLNIPDEYLAGYFFSKKTAN